MFMPNLTIKCMVILGCLWLCSCGKKPSEYHLEPIAFAQLPYWSSDSISDAWQPFIRSCKKINTLAAHATFLNGHTAAEWQPVCSIALKTNLVSEQSIRLFFETYFVPHRVHSLGKETGLFTGYYEPKIKGSFTQTAQYKIPLYKRPDDLVMAENLFLLRPDKPDLKGVRIAGRVEKGSLRPYATRAQIETGTLLKGNEALWLNSAVDAYFIHIQGSAAVEFSSGKIVRLAYNGTNGHPYTSLGKLLIEEKQLKPEEVSMQSIRQWLHQNPKEAAFFMQKNDSYVFFKVLDEQGPVGAQGVVLTPGRSLAVDPVFIALGTPLWLIANPVTAASTPLHRLVIAQDKGGRLRGPIRGDLFWGTGAEAGAIAGMMKSKGHYYVLLPKQGKILSARSPQ